MVKLKKNAVFQIKTAWIIDRGRQLTSLLLVAFVATSCATVPKESVELSYLIGQDLTKLQHSYDLLIQERFADYRSRRIAYLEAARPTVRWSRVATNRCGGAYGFERRA